MEMKDKLNSEVKHREAYRPFAPSSTIEEAKNFFEDLGVFLELKACFNVKIVFLFFNIQANDLRIL